MIRMRLKQILVLITFIQYLKCDIEHFYESYKYDDIKPSEYLDEETENKLCSSDNSKFWAYFQEKVDKNKDSLIDSIEFKDYLTEQIKKSHNEDIADQISRLDPNKSGKINFRTYIYDSFERTAEDLDELVAKNSDPELVELIHLYKIVKSKWGFISSHSDHLDYSNFYKFVYSEEYPVYNDYESKIKFDLYDTNKDHVIDVQEFKETAKNIDASLIDSKTQAFTKSIDLNSDNYLNRHEFQRWFNPTLEQQVDEEKKTVFSQIDQDKDGFLNRAELLNNCKLLLKNQLTNFGLDFLKQNQTKLINDEL